MLDLLYTPESQKQAFAEACAWAEEIYLCLAWIEPGDAQGPSFTDLKPHESKVQQAIVGLCRFQTYPGLIRRLYRSSVLRLVGSVDGSFSPNFYLFRNGPRIRVLLASAPFTSTRFARSCESMVLFEGDRDDPFALRALQLLERCRASAHVPTAAELDAYEDAWAEMRSGGGVSEAIVGLPLETYNGAMAGDLVLEDSPGALLEAFVKVRQTLVTAAAVRVPATLMPHTAQPGTELRTTLFWSSIGVWSALHRNDVRYGLHFGFVPPWEVVRPVAALSLVMATTPQSIVELMAKGATDVMAIARAGAGQRFVIHVAIDRQNKTGDVYVRDASNTASASVIGEVGAADFVQTAAAFALRVSRRRGRRELEVAN